MTKKNRSILFYAPRDIRLVEAPILHPTSGEILIKVKAALTCGTDFKAYRQGHPVLLKKLPSPFGHELTGIIEEVGEDVSQFKVGDRVVAANSAPCQNCYFCRSHQEELCEHLFFYNGAYADYALIPVAIASSNLYGLPQHLNFPEAALSEPLACALHGVEAAQIKKGEKVVLIGAGPMAIFLIHALKERGADICVVGRGKENLSIAQKAGAEKTFSIFDGNPQELIKDWAHGYGADCVFEAVGLSDTQSLALDLVRKGGRICLFAGCALKTTLSLDAHKIHYQEISVFGAFHHTPKYFQSALNLLAQGKIKTELLISGQITLQEVPDYFSQNADRSISKVAVIP